MISKVAIVIIVALIAITGCISQQSEQQVEPTGIPTTVSPTIIEPRTQIPTQAPTQSVGIQILYANGDFGFDNVTMDLKNWTYHGSHNYPFNPYTITVKFYDENKFPIGKVVDVRTIAWDRFGSPEDIKRANGDIIREWGYLPGSALRNEIGSKTHEVPSGTKYVSIDIVTNRVN